MDTKKPTIEFPGSVPDDMDLSEMQEAAMEFAHVKIDGVEGFICFSAMEGKIVAAAGESPQDALIGMFQAAFPALQGVKVAPMGQMGFARMLADTGSMPTKPHRKVRKGKPTDWNDPELRGDPPKDREPEKAH